MFGKTVCGNPTNYYEKVEYSHQRWCVQAWHRNIQSVQLMKGNTHCVHCTNCMLLCHACTSVCLVLPAMSKCEGTPYEHTTCATPIYQCSVHCANCMLNWRACTLVIHIPMHLSATDHAIVPAKERSKLAKQTSCRIWLAFLTIIPTCQVSQSG